LAGRRRLERVPSVLPDGEPVPADGALPATAYDGLGRRPFGIYLHVPFCASRCGYCDFNTYTPAELGGAVTTGDWLDAVQAELDLAVRVLGERRPEVSTVFVGGGTPTLLGAERLSSALEAVRQRFRLAPNAEVTTEANPESVDQRALESLRRNGFTRVSFGVQSTSERVLADLDRQHTPGRALAAIAEAQAAGFAHVSADLIYGAASETDADWRASLEAVAGSGVDHVSAYSLIVEPGTRLAARVARGEVPMPDEDVLGERYLIAEEVLTAHGFTAYEVSNWARSEPARCRHNLGYWTGGDWWGIGPGAHSHVGGVRWWNVKHPAAWTARLAAGASPAYAREILTGDERRMEQVLLQLRTAGGLPVAVLSEVGRKAAEQAAVDGLLDPDALAGDGRAVLTLRGRLLADAVVRDLVD
jgi:putative oxygen-independent coproporphyrinogen III oxidase